MRSVVLIVAYPTRKSTSSGVMPYAVDEERAPSSLS